MNRNLLRTSYLVLLAFISVSLTSFAQKTVSASDIMRAVKEGKDISYENVKITGVLDFTFMDEKIDDLPKRNKWWGNNGDNTVEEDIEGSVSFINCKFDDDVLAYIHDDRSEYTFIAHFERDVTFQNCEFRRDAAFKYTDFNRTAIFEGSTFNGDANFKYTEFDEENTFKGVSFNEEANFKYAEFDRKADFSGTIFDDEGNFKYTKFRRGVSFNEAKFEDNLNMKYTKVRGDFNIKGLYVRRDIDTKYSDINGDSFSRYLLENNR